MKIPTILLVIVVGLIPILSLTVLIFASTFTVVAWQPPNEWASQLSAGASNGNEVLFLHVQSDGLYAGGYLGRSLGLRGPSTRGLFVTRYDLSGHQVWIDVFGDPSTSILTGMALGNGGLIAAEYLNGTDRVQDYDLNGTKAWTSTFSADPYGGGVVSASAFGSTFYLARAYALSNQSYVDVLQAYDFEQGLIWNSTIGLDPQGARSSSLNLYSSSNGVYVSSVDGQRGMPTLQLFNSTGALVWTHSLDCTSCQTTTVSGDGSAVYVAGYVAPFNLNRFFLYKFDLAGNKLWYRQFSPDYAASDNAYLSADSSGIYLAIPRINGGGTVMKYDSIGNQVWSYAMRDSPTALSAGEGSLFIGGTIVGGSYNAFLASFWQSQSLVFLGLNPPFSFVLVAGIAATTVAAVLWLRRHYAAAALSMKPSRMLKGVPSDALGRSS